jgi:hypothetical protein
MLLQFGFIIITSLATIMVGVLVASGDSTTPKQNAITPPSTARQSDLPLI